MGGMPIYSAKRWLKFTSFYFCLYFEVYFIILFCSYYCLTPPTLPIEGWGAWAFSLLFSCINCAWKKSVEEVGCVAVQCSRRFFHLFPWFFAGLWHHWAWVCVYICEVLFFLRLFIFPLLAVSVVVCPIIYLFLLVWFVYWLIVSRIVLICFYANIKSMLTNSV